MCNLIEGIYCCIPNSCFFFFLWVYALLYVYSRWVNTLGMAAVQGIDVVLRHSFFDYGYTHLVDQHFNPLPVSVSLSPRPECEWPLVTLSGPQFTRRAS